MKKVKILLTFQVNIDDDLQFTDQELNDWIDYTFTDDWQISEKNALVKNAIKIDPPHLIDKKFTVTHPTVNQSNTSEDYYKNYSS